VIENNHLKKLFDNDGVHYLIGSSDRSVQ